MLNKEPAVIFGALGEMARAVIPMLLIFNFIHWTQEQVGAVYLVISVGLATLTTLLTRSQTVSTATADKQIEIAKASPVDRPTEEIIKEASK